MGSKKGLACLSKSVGDALKASSRVANHISIETIEFEDGTFGCRAAAIAERELGFKASIDASADDATLLAVVRLEIKARAPKQDDHRWVAVSATVRCMYTVKSAAQQDIDGLACFARVNGLYNAWPYWREYVASCTTRMGLPPLTLWLLTAPAAALHAGFQLKQGAKSSDAGSARRD